MLLLVLWLFILKIKNRIIFYLFYKHKFINLNIKNLGITASGTTPYVIGAI